MPCKWKTPGARANAAGSQDSHGSRVSLAQHSSKPAAAQAAAYYQVMPPLSADDFEVLKADIAARGVLVPVECDEAGAVLYGHHRVQACGELGIVEWPRFIRKGLDEAGKRLHARQLNLARRHMDRAQKRDLIKAQLAETPEKSNRQVAEGLKVDDKTVGAVRASLEAGAEIPHHENRVGKDGVSQPSRRRRQPKAPRIKPASTSFVDNSAAGRKETLARAKEIRKEETGGAHVGQNSGENEWYTPPEFLEAARAVLGSFDLDPASSKIANRSVKAARIFTAQDNALAQDWPVGRIWMNPPYAQPLMGRFAARFAQEVARGSTGIVLVNNATETAWFQTLSAVGTAMCFPRGRIRFVSPNGKVGTPLQGQAILYFGANAPAFCAAFASFGLVALDAAA